MAFGRDMTVIADALVSPIGSAVRTWATRSAAMSLRSRQVHALFKQVGRWTTPFFDV
jgi:hypothetical protein